MSEQTNQEWPKIQNFELSMAYGMNPCDTICVKCGKLTGRKVFLGKIYLWKCLKCNQTLVAHNWSVCKGCGNDSFLDWRKLSEYDGSKNPLPSGMCDTCTEGYKKIAEEIKNGAIGWKCIQCGAEGTIAPDNPTTIAFKKEHPEKTGMMIKSKHCPECRAAGGGNHGGGLKLPKGSKIIGMKKGSKSRKIIH